MKISQLEDQKISADISFNLNTKETRCESVKDLLRHKIDLEAGLPLTQLRELYLFSKLEISLQGRRGKFSQQVKMEMGCRNISTYKLQKLLLTFCSLNNLVLIVETKPA